MSLSRRKQVTQQTYYHHHHQHLIIEMALAPRSNFGNVPKSGRYNDLKTTTLGSDLLTSDEIYVGSTLSGNTVGDALTLTVQAQATTNADGNDIKLYGGAGNGTGVEGQIQFGSNFFTESKTTVTQATSITTGVTVTDSTGVITTFAASATAGSIETFTVTFADYCLTTSVVQLQLGAYGGSGFPNLIVSDVSNGSFDIDIQNIHPTDALDAAVLIYYTVM